MTEQEQQKKDEENSIAGVLFVLGCIALGIIVYVLKVIYDLFLAAVAWIKYVLAIAGKVVMGILALIIVILLLCLILDAAEPIERYFKHKRAVRQAIQQCPYPRFQTFKGYPSTSQVDRFTAKALAQRYEELAGVYPDEFSFSDIGEYSTYKSRELPKLLMGKYKPVVEEIISTIISAYHLGQNEKLISYINKLVEAERKSYPLRHAGRYLNFISNGRIGYAEHEGYKKASVEVEGSDPAFLNRLLWKHLSSINEIEKFISLELEEDAFLPSSPNRIEIAALDYSLQTRPLLLPASQYEVAAEEDEPALENEDESAFKAACSNFKEQAAVNVKEAISCFDRDDPALETPGPLLDHVEAVLIENLEYHPDPNYVYEQLAFVRACKSRLPLFEKLFEAELNAVPDENWKGWYETWMQKAALEMPDNILDISDLRAFKRLCIRHFLNSYKGEPSGAVQKKGKTVQVAPASNEEEPEAGAEIINIPSSF